MRLHEPWLFLAEILIFGLATLALYKASGFFLTITFATIYILNKLLIDHLETIMNKTIDTTVPLFARKETIIAAPIEKVWNVQTDIEGWPEWQSDITSATLQGELTTGTTFTWKASGLGIVSTLHTVNPKNEIGWTGVSLGMFAIHNWMFKEQGNGTLVITEESLSGWLASLFKLFDKNFLEKSLEASLQKLKTQVENQS